MKKQMKNQNLMIIIIAIAILLICYLLYTLARFFKEPTDTVLIKNGELINYDEVTGYVIRNEEIIDTSSYVGTSKANVEDATRVGKGATIVKYMSSEEDAIKDKIEKLDKKISDAMDSKQTLLSDDAKVLDSEIELNIYSSLRNNNNVYEILEKKNYINEKVKKKAKIVGELSPVGSQIKSLIEERTKYEKELNDSEKSLKATTSGLVSYRVDDYENVLTYDSISDLTLDELNKLKVNSNQMVPINTNRVKIVNNFDCLLVAYMTSEESKVANLNDEVYLRFENTGDRLIPASIDYISEEENGRLIAFKVKSNVEELTKYRKIDFDVVWWQDKGLKVNKDAIKDTVVILDDGSQINLKTVTIKKYSSVKDVFVKVIREAGDFAIIENYKNEELIEMGIPESQVADSSTIKMYDEALVSLK